MLAMFMLGTWQQMMTARWYPTQCQRSLTGASVNMRIWAMHPDFTQRQEAYCNKGYAQSLARSADLDLEQHHHVDTWRTFAATHVFDSIDVHCMLVMHACIMNVCHRMSRTFHWYVPR